MRNRRGFTLIELLTVMAVIAILAGITFGVAKGVYERQARTRAEADISVLASGLEAYKARYGSYPATDSGTGVTVKTESDGSVLLFRALANRWNPDPDGTDPTDGRAFVDFSKFDIGTPAGGLVDTASSSFDPESNAYVFLDPWGEPYEYAYTLERKPGSPSATWKRFGFVLFSKGPDAEASAVPPSGLIEESAEDSDLDNIVLD